MKLFFDTNILLDLLVERDDAELNRNAALALSAARQLNLEMCVATITVPTLAYVLKGNNTQKKRKLRTLLKYFTVLDSLASHCDYALNSQFKDIEDAMQYACAEDNKCDLIITRDVKDFRESTIPVMDTKQFLHNVTMPDEK